MIYDNKKLGTIHRRERKDRRENHDEAFQREEKNRILCDLSALGG